MQILSQRRGLVLGSFLAVAVPLASFAAGYFVASPAPEPVAMQVVSQAVSETASAAPAQTTDSAADSDTELTVAAMAPPVAEPEAEPAAEPEPQTPLTHELAVRSGDNLMGILTGAGVERGEAHAAISALKGVYDPRRDLNIGDRLQLTFGPADPDRPGTGGPDGTASNFAFARLVLPVSYKSDVAIVRGDDGKFSATEIERPLERVTMRSEGSIQSSLFVDARDAGLPIGVLVELIRIYSFDVDFQREIQPGDRFEVMYEQFRDETGKAVHNGEVLYARLRLSGTDLPLYRYETTKGNLDWFNAKGESVRKALMRTPIDGARLSSRFGKRKHPILGYTKMHTGIDFAAPSGTPIYAAGSGSIAEIGVKGGYGKYIRIRHNGNYSTAYAHMKGYARGMTRGKRVQQGQVIGYVGTTGRSTGPHLHYEIHRDGKKINPLALKLPSGEKLKGAELERFAAVRDGTDRDFAALAADTQVAGGAADRPTCSSDATAAELKAPVVPADSIEC
ncbi:MAG: peptidoglycan DD-metalloendopeptidase family protein [Alphaproteobacteria bacterium]